MSKQEGFHRFEKHLRKLWNLITMLEYQREPKIKRKSDRN